MKPSIAPKLILTILLGGFGAIGREGEMVDVFLITHVHRFPALVLV
jgi:hypothetical protein